MKNTQRSALMGWMLVVAFVGVAAASPAGAQSSCDAKRVLTVGKYIQAVAKCEAAAEKANAAVDPACLTKAQDKLAKIWDKTSGKSDCGRSEQTAGAAKAVGDQCLSKVGVLAHLPDASPDNCCSLSSGPIVGCLAIDANDCTNFGGTNHPGQWCGSNGSCEETPTIGVCCPGLSSGPSGCAAGLLLSFSSCVSTALDTAICTEDGCLDVSAPFTPSGSSCDATRIGLSGSAFAGKAKCLAKALKTGAANPPECFEKVDAKMAAKWRVAVKGYDCSDSQPDAAAPLVVLESDECVSDLAGLVAAPFTGASGGGCCSIAGAGVCMYADSSLCGPSSGNTWLEDGWCNADGSCSAAAPPTNGVCCANVNLTFGALSIEGCISAPPTFCNVFDPGSTEVADSLCTPSGACESLP